MQSVEAVRYLGLHFIETCKEYLDEETYASAKLIIEKTPAKKLVKKLTKFMKPFESLALKDSVTAQDLIDLDMFSEDAEWTTENVEAIAQQAKMCFTICKAVQEIDPQMLKQIEGMAQTLQVGLQSELGNLPESERTVEDPSKMLSTLFSALGKNSTDNPEKMFEEAMNVIEAEGANGDALGGIVNKVIPNVLNALKTSNTTEDLDSRKERLLSLYSKIDGNI